MVSRLFRPPSLIRRHFSPRATARTLRDLLDPRRPPRDGVGRLLRFGLVGTLGFATDTTALYLLVFSAGLDPYRGRALSFLVGVTTTWLGNRHYTFPDRTTRTRRSREWARFFMVSAPTALVNYGIYALLVATLPLAARHPVTAVAVATLASFLLNFLGSTLFAFRGDD